MISVYNIIIRIMAAILDFGPKWQFAMGGFGWTFFPDLAHQRWTHFRWKSFVNIFVQPPLILSLHCLDYKYFCVVSGIYMYYMSINCVKLTWLTLKLSAVILIMFTLIFKCQKNMMLCHDIYHVLAYIGELFQKKYYNRLSIPDI